MVKVGRRKPVVGCQADLAVTHTQHMRGLQAPRKRRVVGDGDQCTIVLLCAGKGRQWTSLQPGALTTREVVHDMAPAGRL